jgi:type IV pilus assembly protein PilW
MKRSTRSSLGLSLIELMVALTIGSLLIIGAVTVYVQSRNTYAVNETLARLQENARFALSMMEPDLRLANHWGMTSDPLLITGTVGNGPMAVPGGAASCGATYPIDFRRAVDGANDLDDASWPLACAATDGVRESTDMVLIRRAGTEVVPAAADRLQVFTTRAGGASRVFNAAAPPAPITTGPFGPNAEVRDLIVRAYYVSNQSNLRDDVPGLRRKDLVAGPSIQDEEVMPGVEDMQLQFGVDPGFDGNSDGAPDDADANGFPDFYTGVPTRYVNPGDPILDTGLVATVRVWILVRAENPEVGFVDGNSYNYADVVNYQPNDGFRRLLVSRTIQVRNTQT